MKRERQKHSLKKNYTDTQNKVTQKKDIGDMKNSSFSFPFNIWILIGLILTIGIVAFSKYLSTEYLFFFKDIGSDTVNQNYPALVHRVNMMTNGFFTEWSFFKGMGQKYINVIPVEPYSIIRKSVDYIGAGKIGVEYFVYGRFIRIFIFDFLLSGIIFYFYLRTLSLKKFTAVAGALLISFSGYMIVGAGWGFSSHILKAVFLLFAFEQLYLKNRWYFFPFAIIWLSSNVFTLYVYSTFLFIYSIFRFFSEKENKIIRYLKLAGKLILLGLIGLLMNMGQIVRSFMKMYNSPRVSGNASYSDILSSGNEIAEQTNLGASTILRFFSVDILGTGNNFQGWSNYLESPLFYIGLLTLLIAPQVFISLSKRKKIIFGIFAGLWMSTLFIPYLRYAFLAFTGDYFRYGFDFFIPFTLLFFAVFALNELDKNLKINLKLLLGTFIILLIALFFPYKSIPENAINSSIRNVAVLLFIFYAVLLFLMSKQKYKQIAKIGIVLLLVAELSYFSHTSYKNRIPVTKTEFKKDKAGYADGSIKAVKYIKSIDKTPFFRTEKDYQSGNAIHGSLNDALAQNYYGTATYSSFNQLNYVRFLEETGLIVKGDETATRWITGFRGYPLLQTFGNIKYHLSKSEIPEFEKFGFKKIARKNGITILKNKYYLPFGYTYDSYINFNDFKKLISYQITVQSLNMLYQDLSRTLDAQKLTDIIERLKPLLGKKYSNYQLFTDAVKLQLADDAQKYLMQITKYSTVNFKNQIALLNGFVYEKEFNKSFDLSEFEKTLPKDTTVIISPEKFNFEIYKTTINRLKQDTFQISSFSQSEIKGKISLPKTKMLFFTIPFDEGWKIKVDGKNEILQRVNIGFTGIILPKGEHKIKLYYVPQYTQITSIVSLVSIVLFWLYLGFYLYRKRKK